LSIILTYGSIIIFIWLPLFFVTNQYAILTTAQTTELNFIPYSNPAFGIRTEYPAGWGRLDLSFLLNDSADIDFYPLDDTSGSKHVRLQVETMRSTQNMTLEQYSNVKISSAEGQILESNSTTLADLPAREIVFTNAGLKTMQVWTIKDDRIFTITYEAEEEDFQNDLQVAQRMTESFQIVE
jgi:eukaryotic-like serine/threonine-protein kinase